MTMRLDDTDSVALEKLIDKHGLKNVVQIISEIGYAKAAHIRENYGARDGDAAEWVRSAKRVERLADGLKV